MQSFFAVVWFLLISFLETTCNSFHELSSTDGWSLVNPSASFSPRASPHGINYNGTFILTGGRNGTDTMHNDVWSSIDQGVTWQLITKSAAWAPRAYHFCVLLNTSIFVMGGQGGNGLFEFFDDIWQSDDFGKTWTNIVVNAPWGKRAGGYSFVYDNEIYLMGGANCDAKEFPCNIKNGSNARNYFSDVWKSNNGKDWQQIAKNIECMKREGLIIVVKKDIFYLFGGDNGFRGPYFNDVWISNDKGVTWQLLIKNAQWSARTGQVGVLYGQYIIMFGGYPDLTDMWKSKDGKEWQLVTNNCWNCNQTVNNSNNNCGKFDFEFFVDSSNNQNQQRIYTIAGDQEVDLPIPQDNDVWYYQNSSLSPT